MHSTAIATQCPLPRETGNYQRISICLKHSGNCPENCRKQAKSEGGRSQGALLHTASEIVTNIVNASEVACSDGAAAHDLQDCAVDP